MSQAPVPPPVGAPVPQQQGNGLAIAGMVLGIIGLVGLCVWWIGLPCAIVGLILSVLGKKKAKITGTGGGMATAGIVLSIIALALAVIGIILLVVGLSMFGEQIQQEMERQQRMENGGPNGMLEFVRPLLATFC